MYLNNILSVCVASATLAAAETIVIKAENLDFSPANVNASVGDVLEFHFGPNNHSVVMGDMQNPCQPASDGGFYSGFLPVSSRESEQVFRVTVNNTDPMVYYCSQNGSVANSHCQGGMIGFVNQPEESEVTAYTSAAADSSVNISPNEGPFGGVLVAGSNSTNTTTNATSTATATGTSTETGTTTPTSSSTGSPRNSNGGAAIVGSGLLAAVVALMAV